VERRKRRGGEGALPKVGYRGRFRMKGCLFTLAV